MEVAALSVSVWCVFMNKYNTGILYGSCSIEYLCVVFLHVQ